MASNDILAEAVLNVFCPTGPGGGIKPNCGKVGAATSEGAGGTGARAAPVKTTLPKRMQDLIGKAQAAGYQVKRDGSATVVYKEVGRWKKKEGIYVYQDGTALRIGIDLGAARRMTYKEVASVLGVSE
jgi:hypothetical protein